jgi:hypothetical protein
MCRGRVAKASLLLIATCAVLLVSTAAASPAHQHLVSTDCDLCCVGHLPALQSPHLSDIRPSTFLDWQPSADEYKASLDPKFPATLGRAPPL